MRFHSAKVLIGVCAGLVSSAAMAAPTVSFSPANATATSGTLHLLASDSSATDPVGSYQVSIQLVPEAGATGSLLLTAVQGANPLFPGTGQGPLGGPVPDGSNLNTYYTYSDAPLTGGTDPLSATPLDLFDVQYTAAPGTQGKFDLDIFTSETDPLGSYLGGAFDMSTFENPPIPGTTFANTTVTINSALTPEPASLGLLSLGGLALLRRGRKSAGSH